MLNVTIIIEKEDRKMDKLTHGSLTFTWLNGGVTHLDGGAMFGVVPKPLWSKKYPCNENNQIELRTDPIFFEWNGKKVMIESSIGVGKLTDKQKRNYGVTEESSVDQSLEQLGFTREDIDIILMTHLHFDHACGLTMWEGDKLVSAFPNANIYTSRVEWDEMRDPNIRSRNTYWKENWEPIADQVITFEEEKEIDVGLRMVHTGGHSDGHTIILLEHEGETFVHLGDLLPTHAHRNPLWVLAFDDYPMDSIHQKQKWIPYTIEKDAWILFYHDAFYRAIKWDEEGNITKSIPRTK
jgi:glyoxylase-like metal-dependent hydrolase (beta-lactamase superfamily II)